MDVVLLNDREQKVLETIVRDFMVMGEPEGSRAISRKSGLELSPASIRNVISDLEEKGFVEPLHTSSGRVPTDKGYRFYVDNLVEMSILSNEQKDKIEQQVEATAGSIDEIARATSRILSSLSKQLGLVLSPRFDSGIFHRLTVAEVSEKRYVLVLAIESGLVNTVVAEVESPIGRNELEDAVAFINQRLSGRKLLDIQKHLAEMIYTDDSNKLGLVRLFIRNYENLSAFPVDKILHLAGTGNIINQPEFIRKENLEAVIELVENKEMLIHLFENRKNHNGVYVTIGAENSDGELKAYTILSAKYTIGGEAGALGIIGPRRLEYPRIIPMIDYAARMISRKF
ncbi:MAG: heat-inducible transcription repressor HrcA [Fibrobacteres bacterium]|nr:heat-inducible transcription repressor HrcA [Fibrobacterota bacterium]